MERGIQHCKPVNAVPPQPLPRTCDGTDEVVRQLNHVLATSRHVSTFDHLVPKYRSQPLIGSAYDEGDAASAGEQLLHGGAQLTTGARRPGARARQLVGLAIARSLVQRHLREAGDAPENAPRQAGRAAVCRHSQAARAGSAIVSSLAHSRRKKAPACHLTVGFEARLPHMPRRPLHVMQWCWLLCCGRPAAAPPFHALPFSASTGPAQRWAKRCARTVAAWWRKATSLPLTWATSMKSWSPRRSPALARSGVIC